MTARRPQRAPPIHVITRIGSLFLAAAHAMTRIGPDVEADLEAGRLLGAVDAMMPVTADALRPFVDKITPLYMAEVEAIAHATYAAVEVRKAAHSFARANPHVDVHAVRTRVATLVVDITTEQRQALKAVIARRYSPQRKKEMLVTDIKQTVGLTEREANAVMNRKAKLEQDGISDSRIAKETARYSAKLHQARAERIARTESVAVETMGRLAGWKEARDDGLLDKSAEVEWVTSIDPCEDCQAMDGETVRLGDKFSFDGQMIDGPPGHPHCGCATILGG